MTTANSRIKTPMHKKDEFPIFKYLPAKRLAELLSQLPDDHFVAPNEVGNLSIFKEVGDDFELVGFVDFLFDGEITYL